MSNRKIKIRVCKSAKPHINKIQYIFEEMYVRTSVKIVISSDDDAIHLVDVNPVGQNEIFFDLRFYENDLSKFKSGWHIKEFKNKGKCFDLIGFCYWILSLSDEGFIKDSERTNKLNFKTDSLPSFRKNNLLETFVDEASREFVGKFGLEAQPMLWPNGKKYAFVLSHDVDALSISHGTEIFYNLMKGILRRDSIKLKKAYDGVLEKFTSRAPAYDVFKQWDAMKCDLKIPSSFYLSTIQTVKSNINDVRSRIDNCEVDWDYLSHLKEDDIEFGYHPSINAKTNLREFVDSKKFIQSKLGKPIFGIRHHYWALDWKYPYKTYRKHINAGFKYDTSMAWMDKPGFRSGTSYPYKPFDPERNKALEMYILPTALMDGHLLSNPPSKEEEINFKTSFDSILDKVKQNNGVIVVDWHAESASDYGDLKDQVSLLKTAIKSRKDIDEIWFATSWQVIKYVHNFRQGLYDE